MYSADFLEQIRKVPTYTESQTRTRQTMARVALNTLYDPDEYPVDLSEVLALESVQRTITEGFLAHCFASPEMLRETNSANSIEWLQQEARKPLDVTPATSLEPRAA